MLFGGQNSRGAHIQLAYNNISQGIIISLALLKAFSYANLIGRAEMYFRWLTVLLIVVGLRGDHLWACSCGVEDTEIKDIMSKFQTAALVFEGQVISKSVVVYPSRASKAIYFNYTVHNVIPSQVYKGIWRQNYQIRGGLPEDPCVVNLEIGTKYLIYAYEDRESALLTTNICNRTRTIENAEADLRFLRGLPPSEDDQLTQNERLERRRTNPPSLGIIQGRISSTSGDAPGHLRFMPWKLVEGKKVLGEYGRLDNCSDGTYSIRLPAGTYLLGAYEMFPKGIRRIGFYGGGFRMEGARPIELPNDSEVRGINWEISEPTLTAIKGKLTVSDNEPSPKGRYVIKLWNGWDRDLWNRPRQIIPDSNNEFEISDIPPGRLEIYFILTPDELDLESRWHAEVIEILVPETREFTIKLTKVKLVRSSSQLPVAQ
jgi:hypothetical protein